MVHAMVMVTSIDMQSSPQILEAIGTDGEIYYKCLKCGAVGNWKAFIEAEKCHDDKKKYA